MTKHGFGLPHLACIKEASRHKERFVDIRAWKMLATCKWIARRRNSLVFGTSGIGKTYVAFALINKAIDDGFSAFYADEPGLLLQMGSKKLAGISKVSLLVIDEFDPARLSAAEQDNLVSMLGARNGNSSTMLITRLPIHCWNLQPGQEHSLDSFLSSAILLELRSLPCPRR